VKERSEALADADIQRALADGWEISSTAMRYVPLGGGSYHWDVEATERTRWFVSATDLDHAPWLGAEHGASLLTLHGTMNTARTLRDDVGLPFVLSPVPCARGEVVRVVRERYGLVVHPYVQGSCGEFGAWLHPTELSVVVEIVAALQPATRP
jgi:spectinomycin phosphotransferase